MNTYPPPEQISSLKESINPFLPRYMPDIWVSRDFRSALPHRVNFLQFLFATHVGLHVYDDGDQIRTIADEKKNVQSYIYSELNPLLYSGRF